MLLIFFDKGVWRIAVCSPQKSTKYEISARERFPDQLNDSKITPGTDKDDPQTFLRMFITYYPLWDPFYWWKYDQERSSDANRWWAILISTGTPPWRALWNVNRTEALSKSSYMSVVSSFTMNLTLRCRRDGCSGPVTTAKWCQWSKKRRKKNWNLKSDSRPTTGILLRVFWALIKRFWLLKTKKSMTSCRRTKMKMIFIVYNADILDDKFKYRMTPFLRIVVYESRSTFPMRLIFWSGNYPAIDFKGMELFYEPSEASRLML